MPGVTQGMENANALTQQALQNKQMELQNYYFPVTEQAKYLAGAGQYMRGAQYLNPANMLAKFQKDPSFQTLVANNPALAQQVNNIMQTSVNGGAAGLNGMGMPGMPSVLNQPPPQGVLGSVINRLLGSSSQPSQNAMSQPMGQPNSQPMMQSGTQPAPQTMPMNNGQPTSSIQPSAGANSGIDDFTNDTARTQDINASEAVNKTVPHQVQLQRTYSTSFDNQIQPWLAKIPEMANYAALAGKANQHLDAFAEASGTKDSPAYNEFNSFVNVAAPLAGNELRRALGQNSSVTAQKEMEDLSNPATWNEDPVGSLTRFNALMAAKKANDQAIFQSPGQIASQGKQAAGQAAPQYATTPGTGTSLGGGLYQVVSTKGNPKVITDQDIQDTADATKMTPAQVKQKLGIK